MEEIPYMGSTSTPFLSPPYGESFIKLLQGDGGIPKKTHSEYNSSCQPNESGEQHISKKQKKRKCDEEREKMREIISVLKKSGDKGPTVQECMKVLRKL
ncbi:hypothetical protein Ddye_016835 [Dipteronia dyeriana]|uniref:Uncharacterized protein n=1 Tax=Dipteronia dyeriana TaxID=168575 RepID=A0AAD9U7I2_9ROSI|nr:hypothetical protein Ddye_016835 [Dipteronia dyeriana]